MITLSTLTVLDRTFTVSINPIGETVTRHVTASGITMELGSFIDDRTATVYAGRIFGFGEGPTEAIALQNAIDSYNVEYSRHMAFGTL